MADDQPRAGEPSWERRKAWPLLLGSAVTLTGLAVLNYSWANPDGRLTDKAQKALSEKFPEAKVRVHGRDAIITGLPDGVDVDAAHDLVRNIEGVRNVKEDAAATDAAVTESADSIARELGSTPVPTTAVPVVDTVVASGAAEAGVASALVWTDAAATPPPSTPTTGTPMTRAAAPTQALSMTSAAPTTVAPTTLAAPTTVAPTTLAAPTTVAPATLVSPVTSPRT